MEAMRKSWTDDRLDDFADRIDRRFDGVDRRFDEIDRKFTEVDRRFKEVDRRLDEMNVRLGRVEEGVWSLQRTLAYGAIAMTTATLAGFTAMIALVATQL